MPIHPAAPQDLPGKVEAFRQTVQAVIDLGRGLTDDQLAQRTDCPGWTVRDQLAHVAALEAHLDGRPSDHLGEYPEHVRNDLGKIAEDGVAARRDTTGDALTRELEYVLARRMQSVASPGLELDSLVPGLEGPTPIGELLRIRTLDTWVHEQDIREALGKPGNLDSPAAAVFVATAFQVVARAVVKSGAVPVGDTVMIELTGPVTGRIGVRVEDVEGKPRGVVMFGTPQSDESAGTSHTTTTLRAIGADAKITMIKLSTEAFARLAAGRKSPDDVTWTASGDEAAARAVLSSLVFTP